MDATMVGNECIQVDPKKLAYDSKVLFHIMCNTIMPTNWPNSIKGIVGNALVSISHGIKFDIPDLFIRNMACAVDSPQSLKPYAPWIMCAIEQLTNEKLFWAYEPKVFMPPIHDILRIVKDNKKGKEHVDTAANASAFENAPKYKEARIEIDHGPCFGSITLARI